MLLKVFCGHLRFISGKHTDIHNHRFNFSGDIQKDDVHVCN